MAIVLQAEFDEKRNIFALRCQMGHGEETHEQYLSVESFKHFCHQIDRGFTIGKFTLFFGSREFHGISKRTKRGIIDYFKSVLYAYENR